MNSPHWSRLAACCILGLTCVGCGKTDENQTQSAGNYHRDDVTEFHALGWLGGSSHPLAVDVIVREEGPERHPGGIVIRELVDDGPLASAGLQSGDAIVGVGQQLLPNKEDPTLDFVGLVEGEISAEQEKLSLKYLRHGQLREAVLPLHREPLERGLPWEVGRYRTAVQLGLDYLKAQQQPDGSVATSANSAAATICTTAISGLAFLARDDFRPQAKQCSQFVKQHLADAERSPVVAAYALMLLCEGKAAIPDLADLKPIGQLIESLASQQREDGGWDAGLGETDIQSTGDDETPIATADDGRVDVEGTFVTNQVLLALGLAERNGIVIDNSRIEKAIAFLKEQAKARIASPIDRRLKAGLSAGTIAAMVELNVDRSDSFLVDLFREVRARLGDLYFSPSLAVPHTLVAAVCSRQSGGPAWIAFHSQSKFLLTSLQQLDGRFVRYPGVGESLGVLELFCSGDAWRTAHYVLALSLPETTMNGLAAEKSPPLLTSRDGDGKRGTSTADAKQPATAGALKLDFDPTGLSPEELREKLMEQLKEQGVQMGDGDVPIMTTTKEPPE